jgi:ElaB/YqjD/DUF883 family membrane-anchored ribosome-binding protein
MEEYGAYGVASAGDDFAAANEMPWNAQTVRDALEVQVDHAREALTRADRALRSAVRERPFAAVGMTLAIGYLISRGIRA